jgi:hypothetical protein
MAAPFRNVLLSIIPPLSLQVSTDRDLLFGKPAQRLSFSLYHISVLISISLLGAFVLTVRNVCSGLPGITPHCGL